MNRQTARTVNVTPLYLANHHVQPTEVNKGWTNQYRQ